MSRSRSSARTLPTFASSRVAKSSSWVSRFGEADHLGASPSGLEHAAHDIAERDRDVAEGENGDASLRNVYPVGDWRVEAASDGKSLLLSLATPDGFAVSFCLPFDDAQRLGQVPTVVTPQSAPAVLHRH